MLRNVGAFFVFDQRSKLSLGVLAISFDIVNSVIILLASFAAYVAVLRTMFCYSQNARGAICTRSLTSELADSLRLIICKLGLIDQRLLALYSLKMWTQDLEVISVTKVRTLCEMAGKNEMLALGELEMTAKPSWNDMLRISWNKMNPYAPQCISFALANFKTDRSFQESAKRIHFIVLKR